MTISTALGVILAMVGSGGVIFGALRYNREEAGKIIQQHAQILADMRLLNEELQRALLDARTERDDLKVEVALLRHEIKHLRSVVAKLRARKESPS